MALSDVFSRVVEADRRGSDRLAGAGWPEGDAGLRRQSDHPGRQAAGRHPDAQDADRKRLGPRARRRTAAPGLKVNAFATGLKHPRWICVLPNGDVLTAEALLTTETRNLAFRLRHVQHPETGGGHGREPEPHHAFARRRWRRRRGDEAHVPRAAKPAVRNGARRRHVLRRQHRWRRRLSLHDGRNAHHRTRPQAHHA